MAAPARRLNPASAVESRGRAAWQGLSVREAAAASSIAFRPLRRRPKGPDDFSEHRETGRMPVADAPRRQRS